jgi:hypothetical protein
LLLEGIFVFCCKLCLNGVGIDESA